MQQHPDRIRAEPVINFTASRYIGRAGRGIWGTIRPYAKALIRQRPALPHGPDQLSPEDTQHRSQIGPAFQDSPVGPEHRINLCAPGPHLCPFLDPVDRGFGGLAEHREHGAVPPAANAVVPPFARRYHTPVKRHDLAQLSPVKADLFRYPAARRERGHGLECHSPRLTGSGDKINPSPGFARR